MSTQWRVIDLTQLEGEIRSERGAISIVRDGVEVARLPVAELAVVLIGQKVRFHAGAMHRLVSADVAVLFCDWRGVPESGAYAWSDHGRVGARHRAQADVSLPRQKNAWGRLIKAKVRGQSRVLCNLGLSGAGELASLSEQVRSGDPANIEARAARIYWASYLGRGEKRSPGAGALFGPNACLDYGYAVLRGHGVRAVLAAGLSPALGLFHRGRSNMFNLVDDLIEPFRPCIDEAAWQLGPTASPSDKAAKKLLVEAASHPFTPDGLTVPSVLTDLAQQLGRYFEGDVDKLDVPAWVGPITAVVDTSGR